MAQTDNRIYYKIGEASRQVEVPAHTLRYWEREFGFIFRERRDTRGHRLYTPAEIEKFLQLKELLHNQGYRIKSVKQILRREQHPVSGRKRLLPPRKQLLSKLNKIGRLLDKIDKL